MGFDDGMLVGALRAGRLVCVNFPGWHGQPQPSAGPFRAFPGLSGTFPGVVVAVPETPGKRPENPESARKVPETPGKKRPESTPANSRKSRMLIVG